jgi:oligopeptide/dipeptide ABC transporter ATP-binding protein
MIELIFDYKTDTMDSRLSALSVQELKTYFYTPNGVAKAVNNLSFYLDRGESLGLVGESGCGKSVTALSIIRLIKEPPGKIFDGQIWFNEINLLKLSLKRMKAIRGNQISMIFQEPMTSLNPVYAIGDQIAEMFVTHKNLPRKESWSRAVEMLEKVQIPSAVKRAHDYPHQLSGGMRQRVMIAMALACEPEILIADEPTTALDVTIQAQIIDLILELKEDFGTAVLMITHDLGVIAEIAQRIAVMYAGQLVEEGRSLTIFEEPKHPYTQGLIKSVPRLGHRSKQARQRLYEIVGVVPNLYELPTGCSFRPRCPEAMAVCKVKSPELIDLGEGHRVRCWLYSDH